MGKGNTTKTRGNFLPLGSGNSGACVEIEEHEVFEYDFEYPLGLMPACCYLSYSLESRRGFIFHGNVNAKTFHLYTHNFVYLLRTTPQFFWTFCLQLCVLVDSNGLGLGVFYTQIIFRIFGYYSFVPAIFNNY